MFMITSLRFILCLPVSLVVQCGLNRHEHRRGCAQNHQAMEFNTHHPIKFNKRGIIMHTVVSRASTHSWVSAHVPNFKG